MVKTKELDNPTRNVIMQELLLSLTKKGKPLHGLLGAMAAKHNVSKRTISRLWGRIKQHKAQNQFPIQVNSRKPGKKSRLQIAFDETKFKGIEKAKKTSEIAVAKAMEVSQSTVYRWKKRNIIRKHTNAIKPLLNDKKRLTGIFPFTTQVPAQRSSKNKRKGEMETKPIQSISKDHMRDMIVNNILPARRAKWPERASKTIYIQQDNAKPHILNADIQFREAANIEGFDFELIQHPPNSPDMNVLDLGFFRSI